MNFDGLDIDFSYGYAYTWNIRSLFLVQKLGGFMNQLSLLPKTKQYLTPGAVHIPDWLSLDEQRQLLHRCREWAKPPAGLYTPRMLDGKPLSVRVVCLGWHWFPYQYSKIREDCDHLPCKPFPQELRSLADRALAETLPQYKTIYPNTAIVNWYAPEAKLGLHQDKTESQAVRHAGSPIISISLGDSCLFRFGGSERSEAYQDLELHSGDLFVFGGAARMNFHGVMRVFPGTAPPGLDIKQGRLNITIRQSGYS